MVGLCEICQAESIMTICAKCGRKMGKSCAKQKVCKDCAKGLF
ncbi:MAG: hypothetical protein Q8Q35_00335 [Nanoarchaeota archaeon]|nr:hypothetical protein [Nanoarchaeota archaeon]